MKFRGFNNCRTDIALEAKEVYKDKIEKSQVEGIKSVIENRDQVEITEVKVSSEEASKILNKKIGTYITLDIPHPSEFSGELIDKITNILAEKIKILSKLAREDKVLIVGLGNSYVTPDSLGPKVIKNIDVTRHIIEFQPEILDKNTRCISAISPGVLGTTGIETSDIILGIVEKTKPDLVIVIDALVSRKIDKINSTIQLTDAGISPGSGIGNNRAEISENTIGSKVLAIGIPTVVDAITVTGDTLETLSKISNDTNDTQIDEEKREQLLRNVLSDTYVSDLIVTPKDIDSAINQTSDLISSAINQALLI